ncbi:MAG TPA: hypothetical protein VJ302_09865 [Blastocatellia bacterium]|nr:hypothetical protein [Blastocatellia bacterium]
MAATPGSACTLRVRSGFPLFINIVEPGNVTPSGLSCNPTSGNVLGIPLALGVTCGETISIAGLTVRAVCPY